jgi:hypothetical protein
MVIGILLSWTMTRYFIRIARSLLAVAVVAAASGAALADGLTAEDIRRGIIGRTIYLAAPLGGEFPLNYHRNGRVDGDGDALGLGRFIKPADSGRWWVDGDRLCQQFRIWYGGTPMCFELSRTGPKSVKWVRDNGETGVARIGE